jgi:hypothetical protein
MRISNSAQTITFSRAGPPDPQRRQMGERALPYAIRADTVSHAAKTPPQGGGEGPTG